MGDERDAEGQRGEGGLLAGAGSPFPCVSIL